MTQTVRFWSAVVNLLLLFQCNKIKCNNVDTVNYILHEGPPISMFGYNVVLHKELEHSWVHVGAPQATTKELNVTGGMYKCDITDNILCEPISFDENVQSYSHMQSNYHSESIDENATSTPNLDAYRNYSLATGDLYGFKTPGIAIGMPREARNLGRVLLFSWNMTNRQNITGEQIGADFGYSLCAVDVDGDKLDDLIVGAPLYTEPNNAGKHEVGRVYIIFQSKYNKYTELETRDGVSSKGRFGLALTTLNDINLDGYGDFAVGAPYDGPNGRGAVYIFHGSPNGPLEKYSQVIYAEDISEKILTPFGFSVSGGIDLDGNMYPDIVVGAYESNTVVVFKSRPVVVMEASTTFETESKLISLNDKECTLRDGSKVACTNITSCLRYNGINLNASLDLEVSWVLDAKLKRMFFLNDERNNIHNMTMKLHRGKRECRQDRVYIINFVQGKFTPIEVEMKFNLLPSEPIPSLSTAKSYSVLEPVLDLNKDTLRRDLLYIENNCGRDNICIPDLRLTVKSSDEFTLPSDERLVFDVMIRNYGEDAFEAAFFIVFPEGWNYQRINSHGSPISCYMLAQGTLRCDIGNPLSGGRSATFEVVIFRTHNYKTTNNFYMEVNSTNPEAAYSIFDNVFQKSIVIYEETDSSNSEKAIDVQMNYNNKIDSSAPPAL